MKKEQVIGVATVVATLIVMFAGNVSADGVTIGSSEPGTSVEAPDKGGDAGVVIGKETTKPAPAEPSTKDGVIGENKKPDAQPSDVEKPKEEGKATEPSQPVNPEKDKELPKPAPQEKGDIDNKLKEETRTTDQANQARESQVGTTSSVTGQVVQNVSSEAPVQTNTGVKIVSTENGLVKLSDGSLVTPEAVGAVTNADKTISVTKADGKKATLPHTGEAQSLLSFLGVALSTVAGYVFRKKQA